MSLWVRSALCVMSMSAPQFLETQIGRPWVGRQNEPINAFGVSIAIFGTTNWMSVGDMSPLNKICRPYIS